jgi:hypothetical protein
MPAIDIHTHAFPDNIAARAVAKLQAMGDWQAVGDGTVHGLIDSMDAADIDISVVCAIATKPDQIKGIAKWCRKIRSQRIEPLASVHPQTPKIDKWMARLAKDDLLGIKLHPMYQDFAADEERMDPIYAAAVEHDLLVTIHAGRDIAFDPADDRASPARLGRVLDRHPGLKLIATHMGGWESWNEVETSLLGRDVYFETSFSLFRMEPDRARGLIARHGADKVLFGTDWPWNDQADEIARVQSLGLDEADTRRILYGNAAKLLHL